MKYADWLNEVPNQITKDAVWSVKVYRVSLYLSDLCWTDIKSINNKHLYSLSDQLYRATGSISANIAEGYSRNSRKEQARFYEISLGSTREAKDWYFKSRHILREKLINHHLKILSSIAKLLLVMIKERRASHQVKESKHPYTSSSLDKLLNKVPTANNSS
ncbi:four helix bundle protein [Aliifodinibius sp. S!AR15-10]|uniref:four helix bundle protein n=1 Tax=Aliifodinibius sp. S!AR15-10 TaxID=2950437 RepID=UPI0028705103|nr:four helix bundle protein [Aliifodinibius sp. S!AR15-10]